MARLEDFIEQTQACRTEEELFLLFDEHVRQLGVEYSAYFIMARKLRAIAPETGLVRHTFPKKLAALYFDKNYVKTDPIIQRSLKESRPFHWSDVAEHRSLNAQQKQMFADYEDVGFTDGLAVSVFGPMGTIAIFSLASSHTAIDLTLAEQIALQFACLQFHNRYFELARIDQQPPKKTLSPREKEALSLVAAGHANNAIAEQLNVTENTVDTMLRRVFAKLDVHNRISAVVKAIGNGLIIP